MLTLTKHPDNKEICILVQGSKKTPVYWHPRINEKLMNTVEDLSSFNTGYFRDRFELSKTQSDEIFEGIKNDKVCEQLQQKYFKCKRHISDSLLTEMDISDTDGEFVVEYDKDAHVYSGHELVCSGTGSGKTYYCVQKALRNLKGPKNSRRRFLIFSAEWNSDQTLAPLKHQRFNEYVEGIDCSESSLKDSQWNSEIEFFENEIKMRVEFAPPGTVCIFDDAVDMIAPELVRTLINRQLRVARHSGLTVQVILHNLRSGAWSTQAHNSIRYLTVFPRSQKGKVVAYLNHDLGIPLAHARDHVRTFSQSGRHMSVRHHAPELLIGPKLIRLL
jgi:hypothetical protein